MGGVCTQVVDFLTARHGTHFLVVNLSERKYDYSKFFNQVTCAGKRVQRTIVTLASCR